MLVAHDITLGLIAGGKGTRLGGVAKGLLEVNGRPALEWLLRLRPACAGALVGTDDAAQYARFGLPTVADVEPGRGAPGGVVSLLLAAPTPWVFVVACDMPFVDAAVLDALVAGVDDGVEVVVPSRAGRFEPLAALYRSRLGPPWRAQLAGNPSLQRLIEGVPHRAVVLPDAAKLDSLNTPDDLVRHGARLPRR